MTAIKSHHSSPIHQAAFSPCPQFQAVAMGMDVTFISGAGTESNPIAGADKTARIWDMKTGDCTYAVSTPQATANDLPEEVVLQIFSNLDSAEYIASAGETCKSWNAISQDGSLWTSLFHAHFSKASWPSMTDIAPLDLYQERAIGKHNAGVGVCDWQKIGEYKDDIKDFLVLREDLYVDLGSGGNVVSMLWQREAKSWKYCGPVKCDMKGPIKSGLEVPAGESFAMIIPQLSAKISCLCLTENYLFIGLYNGIVCMVGIVNRSKLIKMSDKHESSISEIRVMGNLLYTRSVNTIKTRDIRTRKCLYTLPTSAYGFSDENFLLAYSSLSMNNTYAFLINRNRVFGCTGRTMEVWDFGVKGSPSHPLGLLEENLMMLFNATLLVNPLLEHPEDVKFIEELSEELHPDFKQRLEKYCRRSGASSPWSKEVIWHVVAEIHVEILLHALHAQNHEKVIQILEQLHSVSPEYTDKLYDLLAKECGQSRGEEAGITSREWAELAFHDVEGDTASMASKIQAVATLKKFLRNG